ncbi:MAG: hypothetical protein KME04_04225 [Pleurocapsa minor GSE-CHR-MK-17-07R]|jgi:hypothetical protein|nr:hypothetical protein [Pleurocapsa minor GSE-CHR-MK 17-07R]
MRRLVAGLLAVACLSLLPVSAQENALQPTGTFSLITVTAFQVLPTSTYTPSITPTSVTSTPLPRPTDDPPTSLDGIIREVVATPIFPIGIRFDIRLSSPVEALDAFQMTVRYPGMAGAGDILMRDQFEVLDENTLVGIYEVQSDTPPGIYSLVRFEVGVEAGDDMGQASGAVTFDDRRVPWVQYRFEEGRLAIASAGRGRLTLVREVQSIYQLLVRVTGRSPQAGVLLYDETARPGCPEFAAEQIADDDLARQRISRLLQTLVDNCSPAIAAASYAAGGFTPFQNLPDVDVQISRTLVARFLDEAWDERDVPDWVREGLTRFVNPRPMARAQIASQDAERGRLTFTLEEMRQRPADPDAEQVRWDAQAYGMMLYVLDRAGLEGVLSLASRARSEPLADAYADIVGEPLSSLISRWSRWIFDPRAAAVYGLTPYLPPTPTPSPTRTPSLTFTPSASFTPQPPTEPPTATPTRVPATATVTPTPEPPTATVTPRSASALVTPTAVPAAVDGLGGVSAESRAIILVGVLAVLGTLAVAVVLLGRRK